MKAKVIETGEIVEVYREPHHGQVTSIFKEAVFFNGRMWNEDELDFGIEAEEFPEKIYTYGGEYILANAFIEKAATWIANRYQANGSYLNAGDMEDFEKYMKGE